MSLLKRLAFNWSFTGLIVTTTMSTLASTNTATYTAGAHSVAFVTTPNEETAKKLAHSIVTEKLAACVNIIPKITSIYMWEGKINEDSELLLMIKTSTENIDALSKFVRENHPYTVAEVISLPIENGNLPYLNWITDTLKAKSEL